MMYLGTGFFIVIVIAAMTGRNRRYGYTKTILESAGD